MPDAPLIESPAEELTPAVLPFVETPKPLHIALGVQIAAAEQRVFADMDVRRRLVGVEGKGDFIHELLDNVHGGSGGGGGGG